MHPKYSPPTSTSESVNAILDQLNCMLLKDLNILS